MGYFHTIVVVILLFSSKAEWCLTAGLVYSAKTDSDAVWKSHCKNYECCAGVVMLEATYDQVLGIIFISFHPPPP